MQLKILVVPTFKRQTFEKCPFFEQLKQITSLAGQNLHGCFLFPQYLHFLIIAALCSSSDEQSANFDSIFPVIFGEITSCDGPTQ